MRHFFKYRLHFLNFVLFAIFLLTLLNSSVIATSKENANNVKSLDKVGDAKKLAYVIPVKEQIGPPILDILKED